MDKPGMLDLGRAEDELGRVQDMAGLRMREEGARVEMET
jgi:hypothetical protein